METIWRSRYILYSLNHSIMHNSPEISASQAAMETFLECAPGLREPQRYEPDPSLPTLPDLKKIAQARRAQGLPVIDQSAGDIADVGKPMNPEFYEWIKAERARLAAAGEKTIRGTDHTPSGYPGNYQQQYPWATAKLAESWGLHGPPFPALQTVSGRTAIDFALRGLLANSEPRRGSKKTAIVLDPLAWSGYQPLADDLNIAIIQAPTIAGHGLSNSVQGFEAALKFAGENDFQVIAAIPILPSNPTGVGMEHEELASFIEKGMEADTPVMIDGFYSPLDPEGHQHSVPLGWLEKRLSPETLGYLGVIVGETKVVDSQKKTASLLWMAPQGHDRIAKIVVGVGMKRLSTTNSYPRPDEVMAAYALHTFPQGIHAAMGPRYKALDEARTAMRAACDELGLPFSIGGSFYGTVALVDSQGSPLVRNAEGRPIEDTKTAINTLVERFGLVGAPGGMFSSAPEAGRMQRLTAAVTLEDIAKVKEIFQQMLAEAAQHG